MDANELKRLESIAATIRHDIINSLYEAGSGHIGGSLDLADIFTVLYFHTMKHCPQNPQMPDRDKLILSIGHTAPVLYATLANAGYFPKEELMTLRKIGGRLQGHPSLASGLPGVESASGSLGQGLSICVGMALADKVDGEAIDAVVIDAAISLVCAWVLECSIVDGKRLRQSVVLEVSAIAKDVRRVDRRYLRLTHPQIILYRASYDDFRKDSIAVNLKSACANFPVSGCRYGAVFESYRTTPYRFVSEGACLPKLIITRNQRDSLQCRGIELDSTIAVDSIFYPTYNYVVLQS